MTPLILEKMYETMKRSGALFLPSTPNMRRIRLIGGAENRVGEMEGAVEETLDFKAVIWTARANSRERGGAVDEAADMELHYQDDSLLKVGDLVERIADGTRFRVGGVTDLGGPSHPLGFVARINEVDTR